jgi:type IV secretory pathway VirB4 component
MWGISEGGGLQLVGFFVTLITLGLVPYLVNKNTKQHAEGTTSRASQNKMLKQLLANQFTIQQDLSEVKQDVIELKETRNDDKQEFLKLYERVIDHEDKNK